jgi:hypothetical protein
MVREVPHWECDDPARSDSPHPGQVTPESKGDDRDPPESDTGLLNVWDAFDRNDEAAEPEPEYGDFWPELDDAEDAY